MLNPCQCVSNGNPPAVWTALERAKDMLLAEGGHMGVPFIIEVGARSPVVFERV